MFRSNFNRMDEIDCRTAVTTMNITRWDDYFHINGKPIYTAGIHANADLTIYVKDKSGNISKKVVKAGLTYVGEYQNISVQQAAYVPVSSGDINLIF